MKDLDEDRSASAAPRPADLSSNRVVSTPLFGSGTHFGQNEGDEDDGDISSALSASSSASTALAGPSNLRSGADRDLSSSFARSVSLAEPTSQRNSFSEPDSGSSGIDSSFTSQSSQLDFWSIIPRE